MKKGFTLVELLIVIGLLSVIALIVIAAINPIEQANRARDTKFRADGSQLVSAIERYFAVNDKFPWVTGSMTNDAAKNFVTAADTTVGICGTTCSVDGALITTDELKTEFRNRDFVKSAGTDVTKQIRVGKAIGSSASIYACYVPQSKSIRTKGCADNQVYILNGSTRTQQTCTAADVANPGWSAANPWSVCVP